METKKLAPKSFLFIGSMLFGLFFGAGNLIFPVSMGQLAGSQVGWATLGFLISGIGLPLLGVVSIGLTRSDGVFSMAERINTTYAYIFTCLLYLIIGPFFATPRLATISFQIGLAPFVKPSQSPVLLAVFSVLFFAAAWWFASKPSKIMAYVGKILTPIFLILLGILLITALIRPMGGLTQLPAMGLYKESALLSGFTDGYNTMDALASIAFGVIVVDSIKKLGVTDPGQIAKDTMKSGVVAIVMMGIIYALLAVVGTMSLGKFPIAANGGIVLAQVAHYYFGNFGSVLLAFIVILACLKTAIGLITAFGETFHQLFPRISYRTFSIIASVLPCIFANAGLDNMIKYSTPVLYFIYPLAMTLILISIASPVFGKSRWIYGITTLFTIIPAIADSLNVAPPMIHDLSWVQNILLTAKFLPLFTIGLGWLVPSLIGFVIGLVISRLAPKSIN